MHSGERDLGFALLLDVDSEVIIARVNVEVVSVARHVTGVESTAQFVVLFTRDGERVPGCRMQWQRGWMLRDKTRVLTDKDE